MHSFAKKLFYFTFVLYAYAPFALQASDNLRVPILVYHDVHPTAKSSMTISTKKFEEQLIWLRDNGYTVIPLRDLVDYLQGRRASLPAKSVVITADDGRSSVYEYMWPIVRKYNVPVTLFVYTSPISNAKWAMTWEQLRELKDTPYFDIQGHTYWHPNFKQERKKLSADEYSKLLHANLVKAKEVVNKKLGTDITLLAWPFGIYDADLESAAKQAGYEMAFSIEARDASRTERTMSQPRYMVLEGQNMRTFASQVSGSSKHK